MYSSNPNGYQKYSASEQPSAPPPFSTDQSSTEPLYYENHHPALQAKQKPKVPWSSGLCDCFSDVRNCCITCWCPCITFGQIAEIVDKGSSSCGANGALYTLIVCVTGCACFYSCFYRSKMRQQYVLKESPCGDCLVHCFCETCSLCQEYRELKSHGFDMSIGWHGNVEKRTRGVEMATTESVVEMASMESLAPVVENGMNR